LRKKKDSNIQTKENKPRHIAIIMDGNGRWAKRKSLPRSVGHDAGAKAAKRVINYALKHKIPYLTLFAFSSENWRRPKGEVKALFSLLQKYFHKEKKNLTQIDVKVKVLGSRTNLPTGIKSIIKDLEYATKKTRPSLLLLAFSNFLMKTQKVLNKVFYALMRN
jgi:undecaprenyl diphosphate synthase